MLCDCVLQPGPEVCILPLGTGNDLSRVLGWGEGYSNDVDVCDILRLMSSAQVVKLDRSVCYLTPSQMVRLDRSVFYFTPRQVKQVCVLLYSTSDGQVRQVCVLLYSTTDGQVRQVCVLLHDRWSG